MNIIWDRSFSVATFADPEAAPIGFEAKALHAGDGTEPDALQVTAQGAPEIADAMLPRVSRHQVFGVRIEIDGERIDPRMLVGEIRVRQPIRGHATAEFSVAVRSTFGQPFEWPIGNPWIMRAPAPGKASISITGFYLAGARVVEFSLITNGYVDISEIEDDDGAVMSVKALGPGARHEDKSVTLYYPPAHQTPRLQVVADLARAAGVPSVLVGGGRPMAKAVEIDGTGWRGVAEELAELEGKHLTFDEAGAFVALSRLPGLLAPSSLVLDVRDILKGSGRVRWSSDVPTQITLTGEQELSDPECGSVTTIKETEVYTLVRPQRAHWRIERPTADYALVPLGPFDDPEELRLTARYLLETEKRCGVEVGRKLTTWSEKNPLVWRYQLADDGEPLPGVPRISAQNIGAYVLEEGADPSAEGSEHAYLWPVARLVKTAEEWVIPGWNEDGWKIAEDTRSKGWSIQEVALKGDGLPPTTSWEAEGLRVPTYVLGDGRGVGQQAQETYSQGLQDVPEITETGIFGELVARALVEWQVDSAGYITQKLTTRSGARLEQGNRFRFFGDRSSAFVDERFGPISGERVIYSAEGDAVLSITSKLDLVDGTEAEVTPVREAGYLPVADRLPGYDDSPVRGDVRLIESKCRSAVLEAHREPKVIEDRVEYAETKAELDSLCLQRLREGALIEAEIQLPVHFGIRKGTELRNVLPVVGLAHSMLISEVDHRLTPEESRGITLIRGQIRAI